MMKKIFKLCFSSFLIIFFSNSIVFAQNRADANVQELNTKKNILQQRTLPSVASDKIVEKDSNLKVSNSIAETFTSIASSSSKSKQDISTVNFNEEIFDKVDLQQTTNAKILSQSRILSPIILRCDPDQINAADKASSVFFNWHSSVLQPGELYNYSYTTTRGKSGFGSVTNPFYQVFGLLPGESVTLTVTYATTVSPPPQSLTCGLLCGIFTETPSFAIVSTFCLNETPPVLPTSSTNGIVGTWSPSFIDTSIFGNTTYTFKPDPVAFPCAREKEFEVSVGNLEPDFINFSICLGKVPPVLDDISPNGIAGTWLPSTIDNLVSRTYEFTPDIVQCTIKKTINITVEPIDTITSLNWIVTDSFIKNQIITVTSPLGLNYVYQLDSGVFQTGTIFQNVASGLHSITVKEINGCSQLTENNILVIGYPKFFTPNGDTYNEYWNISELRNQLNCRIQIFDRYGKLLKEISPKELGWDGTFVNRPMPADDYWFTVEYLENSSIKIFKSHFSLKR